ncbi:WGR domain-containing protein [Agrobacterium larrymoorei]|uniref:WGR domain-containing protein n=1 Tax=Agrobacterium larrymoorei TaxID=160699 RepID=A0AAF0KGZ0_9HYPH|nr:WGR domain-containing protein [Agrobacterium larrymoorei]WHA43872.1 WGR domain-containing protein [Agrobacterium larrymoorei]
MTEKTENTIDLRRIDAAQNMKRFYILGIQPTLFGGVSLLRNWGRIGTSGQTKIDTYDDNDGAHAALERLAAIKRRRGYLDSSAN